MVAIYRGSDQLLANRIGKHMCNAWCSSIFEISFYNPPGLGSNIHWTFNPNAEKIDIPYVEIAAVDIGNADLDLWQSTCYDGSHTWPTLRAGVQKSFFITVVAHRLSDNLTGLGAACVMRRDCGDSSTNSNVHPIQTFKDSRRIAY